MELHTKQLQMGMSSAVAAQLWAPQNRDFSKKISKALLY